MVAFEALVLGLSSYWGFEKVAVRAVIMMNSTQKMYDAVMKIFRRPNHPAMKSAANAPQG